VVNCNVCGSELRKTGYPNGSRQYYECPNGCDFKIPSRSLFF